MPCSPASPIRLSLEEREQLDLQVRSPSTPQAVARRARIILLAAQGRSNAAISRAIGVSRSAVARWRSRFLDAGLRGLADGQRTGAPRQIPADVLARVLRMSLSGRASNSTRAIADTAGVSQSTVCRIRRQFGIRPGIEGMRDPEVLALFGPRRPIVTGLFVAGRRGILAVHSGPGESSVLIFCGGPDDETAGFSCPLLRPECGDNPLALLHPWLLFFAGFGQPVRDSRVTGHRADPIALPA